MLDWKLKKISFHVYKSRLKLITAILKKKIMPSEFFVKVSLRKERFLGAFNACISIFSKNRFFFINYSCAFTFLYFSAGWHLLLQYKLNLFIFTYSAIELGKRSRRWERPGTQSLSSDARFWSISWLLPRSWRWVISLEGSAQWSY